MSSSKQFHLSPDLSLPIEAVTQTFAILAKKGSGKTYTGSVMAEEMLSAGQVIVAVDPTGAWYGLRSSADGKHPGFPVVVFGGDHGDLPLNPLAGEMIGQAIAAKRFPAVLDLSLLRKSESIRFVTAFMETLYRLNREPLHLFIDEADDLCPQKMMGEEARMVGAVEDVVKRGRKRGIGCTLITQRPADLNKQVLTQCEVLFALNISHPKDIAPINEWVRVHADESQAKQMIGDLPSLPKGEGWIWSPSWLDAFKRIKIRKRTTFDSGATPKIGQVRVEPKKLAEIDVSALGDQMARLADEAKANDPKELKKRIAELEKEKAKQSSTTAAKAPQPLSATERDKLIRQGEEVARREYMDQKKHLEREIVQLQGKLSKIAGIAAVQSGLPAAATQISPVLKDTGKLLQSIKPTNFRLPPVVVTPRLVLKPAGPSFGTERSDLQKGERLILTAIAQYPSGCNSEQIAVLTGYKATSRREYIRQLKARDYVTGDDPYTPTEAGIAALGDFEPLPTGDDLQRYWLSKLTGGELEIFKVILAAHPDTVSHDQISEATTYKATSIREYTRQLKARRIVVDAGGRELVASEDLFG